ncbi:MAG: amidohydrolase [Oscillospiraceae bacterium]|nr:amidohydrolase [Oscillospiraceae bacterium]
MKFQESLKNNMEHKTEKEKLFEYIDSKKREIVEIRRHLHMRPELSFKEFETAEYICKFYEKYKNGEIEWLRHPVGQNGIAVKIKGGSKKAGKKSGTLAIRGDFDALPVKEETNLPYSSTNPEAMHACGHDAHTAILLETADALINIKKELCGDVVIIHQYAEETPPGGAKAMIEDGVLENVDAIIGGHVWAQHETGEISAHPGMAMAGRAYFKAVITGKGGHGSQPQECIDPILAASHFVVAAQSIASRNLSPLEPAVVTFGRFEGLGSFNVIPNSVVLEGDVRSCSEKTGKFIEKRFKEILSGISGAHGCSFELSYNNDYPPVINHGRFAEFAEEFVRGNLGLGLKMRQSEITMGSEDFAYYQQKIPGLYVFFGAKPKSGFFPHHHPKFDIDENCLIGCVKFFAGFAADFLKGEKHGI